MSPDKRILPALALLAGMLTQSSPVASANPELPDDGPYTDIGECSTDPIANETPVNPSKPLLPSPIKEWPTDPFTCKTLTADAAIFDDPGLIKESGFSLGKGKRVTVVAQGVEPSQQNPKYAGTVFSEKITYRDNKGTKRNGFVADRAFLGQMSRPRP